jgi:hypothetical protein
MARSARSSRKTNLRIIHNSFFGGMLGKRAGEQNLLGGMDEDTLLNMGIVQGLWNNFIGKAILYALGVRTDSGSTSTSRSRKSPASSTSRKSSTSRSSKSSSSSRSRSRSNND